MFGENYERELMRRRRMESRKDDLAAVGVGLAVGLPPFVVWICAVVFS